MRSSRKRSANEAELDPNAYVDKYLQGRGIPKTTVYNDSEVERTVYQRAVDAREDFKRLRTKPTGSSIDPAVAAATGLAESVLTPADKYNRRLENNRKSAAASRVFHDVHKFETAYTLNEVVIRSKQLENETVAHKKRVDTLEKENRDYRDEIAALRTKLTSQPSSEPVPKQPSENIESGIQRIKV
eukprot:IDg3083t1